MTLEEILQRSAAIADAWLVKLADDPDSRYLMNLPPLTADGPEAPLLNCQEYHYAIARLREVITYKYLLAAFKSKQLAVSRESLSACLRRMRKSPVIDYEDWGNYHEFAFYWYKQQGDGKKAMRHLLSCYGDRARVIVSSGKTFDCKDLLLLLLKDHQRMQSFLLYVVHFIFNDLEEMQPYLKRTQYLLLERALFFAVKLFAEQDSCAADLRAGIYAAQQLYCEALQRTAEAESAQAAAKRLGAGDNCREVFEQIRKSLPAPRRSDEQLADYLLYVNYLEDYQIYPKDDHGNVDLEADYDFYILAKAGRTNFMDAFYRPMPSALAFKQQYALAETGDSAAIREVVRQYRSGHQVAVCEAAALAWEKKLD